MNLAENKTKLRNLTLLMGSTLIMLSGAIIAPALPNMAIAFKDVPNGEMLVQMSLTFPALFIAISAPFIGILLDRIGRKPVVIASLILYGVSGAAGFFLNSLTSILISRVILGIATAGVMSGFTTMIGDLFSGEKLNQFMGYQGVFVGFAGVLFLTLSGYLADVGWRTVFLVYLIALFIIPGVISSIIETKPKIVHKVEIDHEEIPKYSKGTVGFVYLVALVGLLLLILFPLYFPFFMSEKGGISNSQVGLLLSLNTASAIITSWLYRRIKAKISFIGIFSMFFFLIGINFLLVANGQSIAMIAIGMLIGGLAIGLLPINVNVWVISLSPEVIRGRLIGGMTTAFFMGQFLAPYVTRPLINYAGLSGMFNYVGVFSLFSAFLFAINHKKSV